MSVQEGASSSAMQKNPDLERLEIALVQLGFALEQQEIQAEAERSRQAEGRKALLGKIETLEARIKALLAESLPQDEEASSQDEEEGR